MNNYGLRFMGKVERVVRIGIFSRGYSGKERGKENEIAEYNFCRVPLTSRKLIPSSVEKKIFSLIRFELYIYLRKLN